MNTSYIKYIITIFIHYWSDNIIFNNSPLYLIILHTFSFRIPDSIGRDIEKKCQSTFPLHDVLIRKVKVLKKPKFDSEFSKWNEAIVIN